MLGAKDLLMLSEGVFVKLAVTGAGTVRTWVFVMLATGMLLLDVTVLPPGTSRSTEKVQTNGVVLLGAAGLLPAEMPVVPLPEVALNVAVQPAPVELVFGVAATCSACVPVGKTSLIAKFVSAVNVPFVTVKVSFTTLPGAADAGTKAFVTVRPLLVVTVAAGAPLESVFVPLGALAVILALGILLT